MTYPDKKKLLPSIATEQECDDILIKFLARYYKIDIESEQEKIANKIQLKKSYKDFEDSDNEEEPEVEKDDEIEPEVEKEVDPDSGDEEEQDEEDHEEIDNDEDSEDYIHDGVEDE